MKRIIKNTIRCKKCGDVIESKGVHNLVSCKCCSCSVDGGKQYIRRNFITTPEEDYEELSEFEDVNNNIQKDI